MTRLSRTARLPSRDRLPANRRRGRAALVLILVGAVAIASAGLWLLSQTASEDPLQRRGDGSGDDGGAVPLGAGTGTRPGAGGNGRGGKIRPRTGADPADDESSADGTLDEFEGREPFGEVFEITPDTLRRAFALRDWEVVRNQIDHLQHYGGTVPADVVAELVKMLGQAESRQDAILCLGQVTDGATGLALAQLAADTNAPAESRIAALDALAKSGQSAGFEALRPIVEALVDDDPIARRALFAVAAMGADGTSLLLRQLAAHREDGLTDVLLSALARSTKGDVVLADELRAARAAADPTRIELLLRIGTQIGAATGKELRAEVKRMIDGRDPEIAAKNPDAAARLFCAALNVAGAMGGDAFDSVVAVAADSAGPERDWALYALRHARGDEAATSIAKLYESRRPREARLGVITALAATESRSGTKALIAALDDEDRDVRYAAASGLAINRDADAMQVILDRLEGAKNDYTLAMHYVKALGTIGRKEALPALEKLLDRSEQTWRDLDPYVRQAIARIQTGNPESARLR